MTIEFVKWFYLIGAITIAICFYIYINLYAKSCGVENPFESSIINDDFDSAMFSLWGICVINIIGSIIVFNRDGGFADSSKTPPSLMPVLLIFSLVIGIGIFDCLPDITQVLKKYKHNKPIKL